MSSACITAIPPRENGISRPAGAVYGGASVLWVVLVIIRRMMRTPVASVLLFLGVLVLFIGYACRAPNAMLMPEFAFLAPYFVGMVNSVNGLDAGLRQTLLVPTHGLLPFFGGVGGVLIAVASAVFVFGKRGTVAGKKTAPKKAKGGAKGEVKDEAKGEEKKAVAAEEPVEKIRSPIAAEVDSLKISMRKYREEPVETVSEDGDEDIFSDIGRVISMAHGRLDKEEQATVFRRLLPDVVPYMDGLDKEASRRIASQALNHYIVDRKRTEDNLMADQFRVQDEKMDDLGRETICRRFMPRNLDRLSEEAKRYIGKTFSLNRQVEIQQATLTQSDDWQDISLRNIAEVMAMDPRGGSDSDAE